MPRSVVLEVKTLQLLSLTQVTKSRKVFAMSFRTKESAVGATAHSSMRNPVNPAKGGPKVVERVDLLLHVEGR